MCVAPIESIVMSLVQRMPDETPIAIMQAQVGLENTVYS